MFILEESQLLEDTIKHPDILKLYKTLRHLESKNDRRTLIRDVISHPLSVSLTEKLLHTYKTNGHSIENETREGFRLTVDQRKIIREEMGLEIDDLASLALVIAASLTQLFVIDNHVGPTNDTILKQAYADLPEMMQSLAGSVNHHSLSKNGSEAYHKLKNPWLLRLAELYWNSLSSLEPVESMVTDLRKIQEHIFDHHIINDLRENKTQLVRFNIVELCCELVQASLYRDGLSYCRKFFDYACEYSGLAIEHTGVLGKRTKFQQKDIPQLMIKVNRKPTEESGLQDENLDTSDQADTPLDVLLDDDTLLPDVAFITDDKNGVASEGNILSSEAQLIVLCNLDILLKSEVMEESLRDEWTLAYLRPIIKSVGSWSVKYKALTMRSQVERKNMRKMDRALRQMEDLIKSTDSISRDQDPASRMRSFYAVLPLSIWQTQRALGDISFDIGLFKNALDIYEKIEFWEGMIRCHASLGQTDKAEKVIRQELEKNETPYLYCLLGDATDDYNYYEKAWTLSNCRFARAKKSIGTYYYVRKNYEKAIEHYEQAHSVNPSNVSILSMLAYSCLTIERYERAAECYRNLTYQDDSSFLAWNNLSKAYIKLGQKERAWRTLREAIKCDYEQWKVWENFMIVSADVRAFDDVITAWHRIIDIKSSHKDDQILSLMTHWLIGVSPETADPDHKKLLQAALQLVARLIATSDCSPRVWTCYFKLLIKEYESMSREAKKQTKLELDARVSKITNALQRATPTSLTAEADWFRIPEKIYRILVSYEELIDCYSYAFETLGARPEVWRQWKYMRLSLTNVMKNITNQGYKSQS